MKIEWLPKNHVVRLGGLLFAFDNPADVFSGEVSVKFLAGGTTLTNNNNLFIETDEAIFNGHALAEIPPVEPLQKGETRDGSARLVYPVVNDPSLSYRAGWTCHLHRGTWSSLPHKFEREEILTPRPMPFYEKFAYFTKEVGGWGCQYRIGHLFEHYNRPLNRPDEDLDFYVVNDVVTVRDRDILSIPLGSHPVSGGPGVQLGYFWIYWGDHEVMKLREKF